MIPALLGFVRGRRLAVLCALLLVAALTAAQPSSAEAARCAKAKVPGGEWRSYGHDYANSRFQPQEKSIGPADVPLLTPAWTFSTADAGGDGDITGTPIVAYGCVYVGTNGGWVLALNADTGKVVWKRKVPEGGNVFGSALATRRRVYVGVNRAQLLESCRGGAPCRGPYVVAIRRRTGKLAWASRTLDKQPGTDLYASPVIFEGMLLIGVSGGIAELSSEEAHRANFQGSMNFLDARTGRVLKKTWTIHPPKRPQDDFAGAGIWSTPAIDRRAKVAYAGTANPYVTKAQHPHSDAVLKFDLDRRSRTFGKILAHYEGTPEEYIEAFSEMPCIDFPGNIPPYPTGLGSCGDLDLDFGASPNLFTVGGRKLVGAGQKSGVYHVFDAKTMKPVWSRVVGLPGYFGGIVGSTAYDGRSIYGPITIPGYVWSLSAANGSYRWLQPIADGLHWGPPVAVANGVVYSVDFSGFLDAFDAATGVLLSKRPLILGGTNTPMSLSWGGVSIARNTVYAAVGSALPDGFVVAFRPGGVEDLVGDVQETLGELTGGGGGGGGGEGARVIAGPAAANTNYATPVVTTQVGGPVSFTNLDAIAQHDVTARELGPDRRPLFSTPLIGFGETTPVEGLDRVKAGRTYEFYCSIHPSMEGRLIVSGGG